MNHIHKYQINVAAKTIGGLTLPSGWLLKLIRTNRENDKLLVGVQTCIESGSPPEDALVDHYENIPAWGVVSYPYNPSADNAKSENVIIKNNFEADLDTWVGAGNWEKV